MRSTEKLINITQHLVPRLIAVSSSSLETIIRNSNIYLEKFSVFISRQNRKNGCAFLSSVILFECKNIDMLVVNSLSTNM